MNTVLKIIFDLRLNMRCEVFSDYYLLLYSIYNFYIIILHKSVSNLIIFSLTKSLKHCLTQRKKLSFIERCLLFEFVPDFMFQEAFLTTYRTLVTPMELINKLLYRYNKFILLSDMRQRAAKNAFALLVRVVDDMWYVFTNVYCLSINTLFNSINKCLDFLLFNRLFINSKLVFQCFPPNRCVFL